MVRSDDAVKIKYGGTKVVNLQQKLDADCFCADIFDDHGKTINHFVVKNSENDTRVLFQRSFFKKNKALRLPAKECASYFGNKQQNYKNTGCGESLLYQKRIIWQKAGVRGAKRVCKPKKYILLP